MNIRKNIDYSSLYTEIDKVIAADLPQMELYRELGRLVSDRPEKGAAVMAAEYISANYPERTGFSPRNLRRMRDFYQMYEGYPEVLAQAMKIGWTQNIVIMEADIDIESRNWYLRTVQRYGWSKAELTEQIAKNAHLDKSRKENPSDTEYGYDAKTLPVQTKRAHRIVDNAVAFLTRLWYNESWQIRIFRPTGIIGEAYG